MKHFQNVLDVCRDCIVYLVKGDTSKFDEEELADILAHRKLDGFNHHQCTSIMADASHPDDERRRECPSKVTGKSVTVVPSRESSEDSQLRMVNATPCITHKYQ